MKHRIPACAFLAGFVVLAVSAAIQSGWSISRLVPAYRQKGPDSARIIITEYSDFQCPGCAEAQPVLKELLKRHEGKVLLLFKHKCMKPHEWARIAARAAECAGIQNRFWDYLDILFTSQEEWADSSDPKPFFLQYAARLKLDIARFKSDLDSERLDSLIQADMDDAAADSIKMVPTFFINKRRLVGLSQLQTLGDQYIEEEKKQ